MFETVRERWIQYMTRVSYRWPEDDLRRSLDGEIRSRLRQLDLILKHLDIAIGAVTPDPVVSQQRMTWVLANGERLDKGEITQEEFFQGLPAPTDDPAAYMEAWDDISIYTDTFYFFAWRVREALNNPPRFPGLGKIDAPAVRTVRNELLQHPERLMGGQNFQLGMIVTSSGPVLGSLGGVARGDSGRVDPLPESKDQGLHVAAEELRDELLRKLDLAISRT